MALDDCQRLPGLKCLLLRSTLFISDRCQQLIECLPTLQHTQPEDVLKTGADEDGNGGDDTADALRYLVNYSPPQCAVRKLVGF